MSASNQFRLSRRDFIKTVTVAIGGLIGSMIVIPSIAYLLSPSLRDSREDSWIDLGTLEEYPINLPRLFEFTLTQQNGWERTSLSYGAIVLRRDGTNVRVFSNVCTHLGCRVTWHPDIQHYVSPCHDGHFDIVGKVVSGPPPRPLDEFITRIENSNLYIQLPPFRRTS
jgi:Rieske Fe-S protein